MLRREITPKDVIIGGCLAGAYGLIHLLAWRLFGEIVLISALGMVLMALACGVMVFSRRQIAIQHRLKTIEGNLLKAQGKYYTRLESLISLLATLQPTAPFPNTGGVGAMAASPDFLKKIAELIYQKRPQLVVEASCGLSTLVVAYCLKNLGDGGRVISLEHEAQYAALTRELMALHGLEDVATVIHAPLKETPLNGKIWQWYNLSDLPLDTPIDVLCVDGPPGKLQSLSRYPALPMLFEHLSEKAAIVLDDGKRADEQEIVALWTQEFAGFEAEFFPLERGAYLLQRQGTV